MMYLKESWRTFSTKQWKKKTNRDMINQFFWLAPRDIFLCCDWPLVLILTQNALYRRNETKKM